MDEETIEEGYSMNIIIVGCGKVGMTLARELRQENHAITVVDVKKDRL